jgi:putative flippase GtrA
VTHTAEPPSPPLLQRLRGLVHEVTKFGIVGAVGMVVDLGGSNLLRFVIPGPLQEKPLTDSAISMVAATIVTYLGNRHWTWRDRSRRSMVHEYGMFFVLNGIALVIALLALGFVTYVLGLDSKLWFNIGKIGGIGLGTLFRFWSYRRFVFKKGTHRSAEAWDETAHTTV